MSISMQADPKPPQEAVRPNASVPARAWAILAVTYLVSIAAPMTQFKVPPLAHWIIPAYGLNGATFGMLMSAMSIIGIVLAFPAAFICRRLGLKTTMLASSACLCIGSALGALTDSGTVLMASRMIEGIGIGIIGVAAPTCVSIWFPPQKRGLALGIWATWVPLGLVTMFNVAPGIASALDFKAVFWLCAAVSLVGFILFALVFKLPEGETGDMGVTGTFTQSFKFLKNKYVWMLGIVFFCFTGVTLGITNSFYNTFLETVRGFDTITAGHITSINMALGFIVAPLTGYISDKCEPGKKRFVVMAMVFFMFVAVFLKFYSGENADLVMGAFIVIEGIAAAGLGGAGRPLAPLLAGNTAMGAAMSMSVLMFCQNLGTTLISPLFGAAMDCMGWVDAGYLISIPLCIVAFVVAFFINPWKKDAKVEE